MNADRGTRKPLASKVLGYLCAALIAAMAVLMTIQVVGRYVLQHPPDWTEELARVAFVYATFFGAALAVMRRAHLGIDVFANMLPNRVQTVVQIAWRLMACVILAVIIYHGYFLVRRLSGQPLTSVPISKGFMFGAVPIGCALILVYELKRIAEQIRSLATGRAPIPGHQVVSEAPLVVQSHKD